MKRTENVKAEFLAENLKLSLSASIAFDRSNANMGHAHSIITTERENKAVFITEMSSLFLLGDIFFAIIDWIEN